jgi:hypothetical protein
MFRCWYQFLVPRKSSDGQWHPLKRHG